MVEALWCRILVVTLGVVVALVPGHSSAQRAAGSSTAGLSYEATGTGDAVVLIHAFSVDRRMWAPQVAALEGRFRVIRYDLRGHGQSAPPTAPYATHEDLRSVLDALGVERATLIGLSAGAEIATDFALMHPERVRRLVLASPGLSGYVPSTPMTWAQPVFEAAGAGDAERAARLWVATPLMTLHGDQSAAKTVSDLVMSNVRLWSFKTNPVQPLDPPAIKRLANVKCPVLVIVGEQDLPHIKDAARLLVEGIPGARQVSIPAAGHLVNLDASTAFNRAVDSFLGGR
jgi:pimeloyl-ACP methyl ester carboxylesterase